AGLRLARSVVYEMRLETALPAAAAAALRAGAVRVVPAYSPRAARQLARLLGGCFDLSGATGVAISAAAAAPLRALDFGALVVADAPTGPAMRAAMTAARDRRPSRPLGRGGR
ncbi:MAG: uroporphyrinogen-III synthase, partial [Pseudomonadota bacterium]|nr:uroporphyrinogen-III synthase [Pseudomonadota bacterium]